jgi:hypothetical protein
MYSFFGMIFMIIGLGLLTTLSGWSIPWLLLGCTGFWAADQDDWNWDVDFLGGAIILLFAGVLSWTVLIKVFRWMFF